MATTHTLDDGSTVSVRGVAGPEGRYDYATVFAFDGPAPVLLARSAEAATKAVLADHRTASWAWLDDRALSIRFTREDPEHAADVAAEVLDRLAERYREEREQFDDGAFDRALSGRDVG